MWCLLCNSCKSVITQDLSTPLLKRSIWTVCSFHDISSAYFTISSQRWCTKSLTWAHQKMVSSHLLWFLSQIRWGILGFDGNEDYSKYNLGSQSCLHVCARSLVCKFLWNRKTFLCLYISLRLVVFVDIYIYILCALLFGVINHTALSVTDGANEDASTMILPTPVGARMIVWDLGRAGKQNEAQISLVNKGQWDWHAAV